MRIFLLAGLVCVLLNGCSSIPADRGSSVSESLIAERSTVLKSASVSQTDTAQRTHELLSQPLSADTAVQIALLNQPRMRMWYADLGLAQAELYDATRLANPSFGFAQLSAEGVVTKTTLSVSQRITELLFLHFNSKMARAELLQTQQRVANEVLSLEAEVRAAYYQYVTAKMIADLRQQIAEASTASSQYAESLYAAGNISVLQLSREQIAASESLVEQHRSVVEVENRYTMLLNALGISRSEAAIRIDERLPQPGELQFDIASLQAWALSQRLDIAATRDALKAAQQRFNHTRHWRWLGNAEVGAERERDRGDAAAIGP
ncbi:MAG TPA: TolC family protein, partial [Steroidobacteraceae bacterium]|nr:TolC family protein [Steroidobacteraceae bacterium]